ncbi:hypothetical protein [Phaeocystidibacter marisrubri]|uniref:Uncharacterized protein n=1 Tax=Phaeocystidibacter marisrubri TaxID=1577780 RepID=A0A6L3ZFU3_9FLAO|nr:hypothetical protein [Phaeocystidibacter marisrubri]KAB2816302.1 hypothetical protein F8C82_11500 [Phaeocystidibacter marisrubri]GGH68349.1 hypothetical protein GCM10011318_08280 [Phaeocystidibacter marisrubri]
MKQIIKNSYIKAFKFTSFQEATTFVNNQDANKQLSIDDTFGDNYYCYVGYHSLTKEKQFILSFSSDESDDSLNFLFWDSLFVLDTGNSIYLIDEDLNVKTSLEITTPLVGLYLINKEKLLVLEEAYMRVINCNGDIVKAELFDLIEDFSIKDNFLSIQTSEENKVIELI